MYYWSLVIVTLIAFNLLAVFTIHVDKTLSDVNQGRPPYTRKKKVLIFVSTNVFLVVAALVGMHIN